MSSSISSSDAKRAMAAMGLTLVALLFPYELMVRQSESRFGRRIANIALPRTPDPKIETFLRELEGDEPRTMYIVGNSLCEFGLRPSIVEQAISGGSAYNLGFGGLPPMQGLEMLELAGERPELIVLGVAPRDFTDVAERWGSKMMNRYRSRLRRHALVEDASITSTVEHSVRTVFLEAIRSAASERRRTLIHWLGFLAHEPRDLLAFLNNPDAGERRGPLEPAFERGYLGHRGTAPRELFVDTESNIVEPNYLQQSQKYLPVLRAQLADLRARGIEIIVVRVPVSFRARKQEDRTSFDADIRALCRAASVAYVDGRDLVDTSFVRDVENFFDLHHLNSRGSLHFSNRMRDHLRVMRSSRDDSLPAAR